MVAFGLPAFLSAPDPFRSALYLLFRGGVFMAVGGPIVALRYGFGAFGKMPRGTEPPNSRSSARPR